MSLPYFPMFPTDFEAKTSHLTLAEDGAYNRLLRLMWMTPGCTLPADDAWLKRRLRVDQETFDTVVRVVLDEFFTVENGRLSNAKLARIHAETNAAHEKRVQAGSKGGKAKALKTKDTGSSNAKAMPKQPEPEPEPELKKEGTNVPSVQSGFSEQDFQDFWDAYPHRNGKKKRKDAKAVFAKAIKRGVTVQEIAAGVENMRNDPDVQRGYSRDPTTWLNQQGWKDEFDAKPQFKTIDGGRNERTNRTENEQRPDPALEQIFRLARVEQTPGDGRG